jgi:hypothetical protein
LDKCFKDEGNYNIFRYLYLLPAQSLYYNNLYQELYEELDEEYKKQLAYGKKIELSFVDKINNKQEHQLNLKDINKYQGKAEFIPGEVIKKEIKMISQDKYSELIRIDYFTKFYSINDIEKNRIKNNEIKLDEKHVYIFESEDNADINKEKKYDKVTKELVDKFKEGKKITIEYNFESELKKEKKDYKTIINYIFVNKKPYKSNICYKMKFKEDLPENIRNNSIIRIFTKNIEIDSRAYKVINQIQRRKLNSNFFENDDLFITVQTDFEEDEKFGSFFLQD